MDFGRISEAVSSMGSSSFQPVFTDNNTTSSQAFDNNWTYPLCSSITVHIKNGCNRRYHEVAPRSNAIIVVIGIRA
jgi:hypothetical protein